MPLYEYECTDCSGRFETFESMTENASMPTPNCPKCDPEQENETTMFRYMEEEPHHPLKLRVVEFTTQAGINNQKVKD